MSPKLKRGDRVRLTIGGMLQMLFADEEERARHGLRWWKEFGDRILTMEEFGIDTGIGGCRSHIEEFGNLEGVVLGHPCPNWPEWDVRWETGTRNGLRHCYDDNQIEKV